MLKRLAILGFLVLVSGAWSQVPGNGGQQEKNAQDQQKTANSSKPVVVVDSQHSANNQEQDSEKPAKYPWGELLAPANVPNWFLVIVGGITGWFVYKTLRAIKKQADIMEAQAKDAREAGAEATKIALATAQAAQTSADVAMAQIRLIKDKERGRLRIEFDQLDVSFNPEPGGYKVTFKVFLDGTTQAYIVETHCIAEIYHPASTNYDIGGVMGLPQVITPAERVIEGAVSLFTDSCSCPPEFSDPNEERVQSVREGKLHVFLKGFIRYADLFGGMWEVRFNQKWQYNHDFATFDGVDLSGGTWLSIGDNGEYPAEAKQHHKPN
jgi:hypothetical protein